MKKKQNMLKKYAPRLIEFIIDRWSALIIHAAFLGIHRFDDFHKSLGIAPNMLSMRLQRLKEAGIFKVTRYNRNPVRYEYHFTEMGRDLYPLIICIKCWGDKWLGKSEDKDEQLVHTACGHVYEPVPVCSECGEKIEYGDVLYDATARKAAASNYLLTETRKRRPVKMFRDAEHICSAEKALNLVGDRWSFLIIREALLGVKRFETFMEELDISRTILAARLKYMVSNDIFYRRRYSEHPPRYEYRLTKRGCDLYMVGLAAISWENKWLTDMGLPALSLRHKKCGKVFNAVISCSHCTREVNSANTRSLKTVTTLQMPEM